MNLYIHKFFFLCLVCITLSPEILHSAEIPEAGPSVSHSSESVDITTATPEEITTHSARLGGSILDDDDIETEVTERGVAWSAANNPEISDNRVDMGSGTGGFSGVADGMPHNTVIYIRAFAIVDGETIYGNEIQFRTADLASQTINFSTVEDKTYGDEPFEIGPEFSSEGLPVTYVSGNEDVITINGNEATIHEAGSATIRATQQGNDTTYPAEPVEQSVTIRQSELSVQADENQSKLYGEEDPELTFQASNFKNGDDESILSGELSREEGDQAGSYPITTGSLDAGRNYTIRFIPADFQIQQRDLTLDNFTAGNKTYDGSTSVPGVDFSDNRLSGDDLEFSYTAQFESWDAGTSKTVQLSDIEITGGTDGQNYNLVTTAGTAEADINPRPVTITAQPVEVTYGEQNPDLEFSISEGSLVEGDEFTGSLTRPGERNAGEYEITQGTLTAGDNYTITFEPASYKITPRILQVAVDANQIKTYGEGDPEFTFKANNFAPGEDEAILEGSLSRQDGENVGTYTINQHTLDAGDNYEIEFSPASFEIEPKELHVEVKRHQSKVYGSDDPELEFNATGFAFNEDEEILSGSLTRETGEDTGMYEIKKGDLSAGDNYTLHFEPAEFEIRPRPLVLNQFTVGDKTYDGTPAVSGTGFQDNRVEGDDLEFSYDAVFEEPGGGRNKLAHFTEIEISGGEDQHNYRLLTTSWSVLADINPRSLKVAAQPVEIEYGDDEPALEYEITSGSLLGDDELRGSPERTGSSDAGRYEIRQGTLTAGDSYEITFKKAPYIITPKKLTVTVTPELWKFEGEEDPDLTYNVTGFADEDDASILAGSPEREPGEKPGTYNILRGSLQAGSNYDIELEEAGFSILRTPPVVQKRSPEPDETRIELQSPVTAEFDHDIILADAEKIIVTGPDNNKIDVQIEVEGRRLRLLQNDFIHHTTYSVVIEEGAIVNVDGIANEETSWQFRTIMPPAVVETHSPGREAIGVGFTRPVVATFNQDVESEDLDQATITRKSDDSILDAAIELENNQLVMDPGQFEQFEEYWVQIPENSVRNADEVGNESYSWSFTTVWAFPEQVIQQAPVDRIGSVERRPSFEWEPSLHADTYQIQVSQNRDFADLAADAEGLEGPAYELQDQLQYNQHYFWRIRAKNSTGQSDWSDTRDFYTLAETPGSIFPVDNAEEISIAPLLEWTSTYYSGFRVQLSETDDFTDTLTDQYTNENSVQLSGLGADREYFWRVRVENDKTTSDWTPARRFQTRPAPQIAGKSSVVRQQIEFGEITAEGQRELSDRDFRLVGLPGDDRYSVSDLFDGNHGTHWQAYSLDASDGEYKEFKAGGEDFTFTPGRGFWVSGIDNIDLELPVNAVAINENDAYPIPLNPGWNIISNPHTSNISWQDVQAINQIRGELYSYNSQFTEADTLQPVHGYYYYNPPEDAREVLEIPYSGMGQRQSGSGGGVQLLASEQEKTPSIIIQAEFGAHETVSAEVLYPALAEETQALEEHSDRARRFHPPLEMARRALMLADPEAEHNRGLIREVGEYIQQGSEYELHLKGEKGDVFAWRAGLRDMPDRTRLLLVNSENNQSWLLQDGETVEAVIEEENPVYTLFAGDRYWMEQKQKEFLPEDFVLYPNYPNPFNPVTHIRYSLPEKQHVRLEVYDVIGRRVQVLKNDEQPAGWHTVRFDASSLASGVYLYRITTENNESTRKMTVVK